VEELVEEEVEDDDSAPSDDGAETEPADGALGTGFGACDPGEIDDNPKTGVDAVKAFQTAYNENYKLLGGSGEISVDGDVGKQTWGAIYDLYQYNLAQELGETFDGLKELQGLTNLLPTSKPYVGFGESAPADGTFEDNADEQLNRRVEVLFFEYGQEPDVALLDEDPHVSDLYHGETFERAPLDERWPADVRVVGIEGVFEYVKDTFPLLDSPKAFEIAMRKVFGDDLSRDTIDALRNELASGSFPPPGFEITDALPQGVRGAYSTGLIHVSRKTAESARVDALARWKLFTVMLEEYGHYVDDQVRRRLATDVARDAVGDEGTRFGAFYMCYHELFTTDFDFGALRVRRGLRKPIRRSRLQIAQGNPPTEERAKFFLWAQEEGSDSGYVTVKGETYQAEYFKIEGQGAVHERITREAAKAAGVTFDDRLDIGVAWPDVPTWDENSPPAPTASSVMTKDQVRYNSPHAAYAAFLSMETAHNMGKADKNSPAYKSHYGQNQFWHAMSPGKHLTNGQVRDKILRQHEIWWSWALANRFATVGVPLPTGILP
jgi:hypothetical protein